MTTPTSHVVGSASRGYAGPIEDWLPLVAWVLNHKLPFFVRDRLGRDDLYQAGVEGLLNAQRLFQPDKGAIFKTYAVHKIRWAMLIAAGLTRHGWEQASLVLRDT